LWDADSRSKVGREGVRDPYVAVPNREDRISFYPNVIINIIINIAGVTIQGRN